MVSHVFSLVFSIAMFGIVINAIRQMSRAGASRNWFTTNGQVVYSSIHQESDGPYFVPVVKYRYRVEGQEYESSRIRFTWSGESTYRWTTSEVVNKYPVSKTVRVYYNPKNPSVSVLVPGVVSKDYISAFIGFLVLGWMVLAPLIVGKPTNSQPSENSSGSSGWVNGL
jgi:hypothetical protein